MMLAGLGALAAITARHRHSNASTPASSCRLTSCACRWPRSSTERRLAITRGAYGRRRIAGMASAASPRLTLTARLTKERVFATGQIALAIMMEKATADHHDGFKKGHEGRHRRRHSKTRKVVGLLQQHIFPPSAVSAQETKETGHIGPSFGGGSKLPYGS